MVESLNGKESKECIDILNNIGKYLFYRYN
jgi:hypothetical protein